MENNVQLSEEELAAQRIASVERQLHKIVPKGFPIRILCPYCGTWNSRKGGTFCCELLRRAVVTVLTCDRMLRDAQAAEKVMNN